MSFVQSMTSLPVQRPCSRAVLPRRASRAPLMPARAAAATNELGFKEMRKGIKEAASETILSPRFYTTDFDEMEEMFSLEKNPNLPMAEFEAMVAEFKTDYNQTHFVRNDTFPVAAENITGATRRIFIEFLERSCTAEFSGFLLYKELGRRLKKSNPVVAEIFTLMSRDEARHAGFLNKAMSDFGLALDLGFMTKNRTYTFFKPYYIFLATYLSEKIGYWRYITIYRHLQRNPDNQLYPLFEYFENWCQDENRHGDFFAAVLKSQPQMVSNDLPARLWARFFCLSVYITMQLNDSQRAEFYESLGMHVPTFNKHVIIETNKSTARIFPEVPDVEAPIFWERMDKLEALNKQLIALGKQEGPLATLQKLPILAQMIGLVAAIFFGPTIKGGSVDMESPEQQAAVVY